MSLLRNRLTLLVALAMLAVSSLAAVSAGSAQAAVPLSASASAAPPNIMCPISATASAGLYSDGLYSEGRLHTSVDIGPNEYWFVGCRINVRVDLYAYNPWALREVLVASFEHQAVAGSLFDPWGNHKWPSFDDTFPAPYAQAATRLEITFIQQ